MAPFISDDYGEPFGPLFLTGIKRSGRPGIYRPRVPYIHYLHESLTIFTCIWTRRRRCSLWPALWTRATLLLRTTQGLDRYACVAAAVAILKDGILRH